MITLNLGTGIGYSVLDVVNAFAKVSSRVVPYVFLPRRLGDVAINYADAGLAKRLIGWTATRNLEEMCADTWKWQSINPKGYSQTA